MPDQTVDLYRLTSETISNDPVTANIGAINYTYDAVGNRQMRSSGITAISTQNFTGQYDPNDRLTVGYTYDGDGNTLQDPAGNTYQFDSLDRMTQATVNGNTSTYIYDGDGNKVQETSNSGTRMFLVDSNNPTGYAQVLEVLQGGGVSKVYTYGRSRISEDQVISGNWTLDFYGYDGTGTVRYLTDVNGNLVNQYEFDAFGNTISTSGTVPNVMLYDGEEQSPNTGFYYLRARWMNPGIGRFQTMDSCKGNLFDPPSLHKYLFGWNDPVNLNDPTGNSPLTDFINKLLQFGIQETARAYGRAAHVLIQWDIRSYFPNAIPEYGVTNGRIDLVIFQEEEGAVEIYEIKPLGGTVDPERQLDRYIADRQFTILGLRPIRGLYPFNRTITGPFDIDQIHYWLSSPGVITYEPSISEEAKGLAVVGVAALSYNLLADVFAASLLTFAI